MAFVIFANEFGNVGKEIVPLSPVPTMGPLIVWNAKQPSLELVVKNLVLRLDVRHADFPEVICPSKGFQIAEIEILANARWNVMTGGSSQKDRDPDEWENGLPSSRQCVSSNRERPAEFSGELKTLVLRRSPP